MGQPPRDSEWESIGLSGGGVSRGDWLWWSGKGKDPIEAKQLRSAYNLISVVFCLID